MSSSSKIQLKMNLVLGLQIAHHPAINMNSAWNLNQKPEQSVSRIIRIPKCSSTGDNSIVVQWDVFNQCIMLCYGGVI